MVGLALHIYGRPSQGARDYEGLSRKQGAKNKSAGRRDARLWKLPTHTKVVLVRNGARNAGQGTTRGPKRQGTRRAAGGVAEEVGDVSSRRSYICVCCESIGSSETVPALHSHPKLAVVAD